jgi:predicted nuclease of predicted toxin-antitoxin system
MPASQVGRRGIGSPVCWRILITDDRDFGDLVFRLRQPHAGVIFLRLGEYAELATKIARLEYALTRYQNQLNQFLVVTPRRVRIRRGHQSD